MKQKTTEIETPLTETEKLTGIKIYNQVQDIPLSKINLNNWNPNFETSEIQKSLKDDIRKNGFLDPIILQKRNKKMKKDLVIIDGEHRYLAFKEVVEEREKAKPITEQIDIKKLFEIVGIPSIILDCPDKTAIALTIRLNRERGSLMPDKLGAAIKEISPNSNIDYLHDTLFIPRDELLLLTSLNDDLDKRTQDLDLKSTGDLINSEKQREIENNNSGETGMATNEVNCPKCHFRFMLPINR